MRKRTDADEPGTPAAAEPSRQGPRVLLVDDDADSCDLFKYLLEQRGLHVTVARSMNEALEAARNVVFDLLLSDVTLPDGDGCELLVALRQTRPIAGIAVTGLSGESIARRCSDAGFVEHFVKPPDVEAVFQAVQRLVGR